MITIIAEHGTSIIAPISNPPTLDTNDMPIEAKSMPLNL